MFSGVYCISNYPLDKSINLPNHSGKATFVESEGSFFFHVQYHAMDPSSCYTPIWPRWRSREPDPKTVHLFLEKSGQLMSTPKSSKSRKLGKPLATHLATAQLQPLCHRRTWSARWEDRSTQPLPMPGAGTPQNEKSECGASYPAPRSPPPPAAIRTTLNCSQETMIQYDSVWFSTFYWDLKPGLRKKLTLTHDHPLLIQSKEEKHIAFEWPSQEFRFY